MFTFFVAYSVVWLAVLIYVARLGVHQRRMQRTIDSLHTELEGREKHDQESDLAA